MGTLRAPSTAAALLLSAALTLSAPGAAAAADHSGAAYAALGDSYSSGLGAGDYLDGSGACRRSANAYPEQWAARHEPASFAFAACAGATVRDVLDRQLGALGPSTRLVSVTVGGNDAGFAGVMAACVLSSEERCLERIGSARSYGDTTLPGLLDRLYAAIRAAAPDARVVVLGYPRLYRLGADCPIALTPARRRALDDAADCGRLPTLDGIADTLGASTTDKLLDRVRPGGVIASVASEPKGAQERGIAVRHHWAHPDPERLAVLVRAVAEGALVIPIAKRFPLAQIREAQEFAEHGAGGKVIVRVTGG